MSLKQICQLFLWLDGETRSVIPCQSAHHLQSNTPLDNTCWTAFISSVVTWCTEKPFQVITLLFHFYSCWETALSFYSNLIPLHKHRVSLKVLPVLPFMHTDFLKLIISYEYKIIFNPHYKYNVLLLCTSVKQLSQKPLSYMKPVSTGNLLPISPLQFSLPFFTLHENIFSHINTALVWKYS